MINPSNHGIRNISITVRTAVRQMFVLLMLAGCWATIFAQDRPALVVLEPTPNKDHTILTSSPSILLRGSISGSAGLTRVFWQSNRGFSDLATVQRASGGVLNWSTKATVPLRPGINHVEIKALDQPGLATFVNIFYTPAAPQPKPQLGTTILHGKQITYEIRNGFAVYQNDIVLGPAAEVGAGKVLGRPGRVQGHAATLAPNLLATTGLWPVVNGVARVPYSLSARDAADPNLPTLINTSVAKANSQLTGVLQWVPATGSDVNQVEFDIDPNNLSGGGCESSVGMVGGTQTIGGSANCTEVTLLHEMGHSMGLFHEQSRFDRNTYVNYMEQNIDKLQHGNFDIFGSGVDSGLFNFASIMEYGPFEFARDGLSPVLETIPAGMVLSTGMPAYTTGDLDGIMRLYGHAPTMVTVDTNPTGLQLVVDGSTCTAPCVFTSSSIGSMHTAKVPLDSNSQTLQVLNGQNYIFGEWNTPSASQSINITVAAGDGTELSPTTSPKITNYLASFIPIHPYSPVVAPTGDGTITPTPPPSSLIINGSPTSVYQDRQLVSFQVNPISGFNFYNWGNVPLLSLYPNPLRMYIQTDFDFDNHDPSFPVTAVLVSDPVTSIQSASPDTTNLGTFPGFAIGIVETDQGGATTTGFTPEQFAVSIDGAGFAAGQHLTLCGSNLSGGACPSTPTAQTPVTFNINYLFNDWSGAGSGSSDGINIVVPASGTATYVANYTPSFRSTVLQSATCGGNMITSVPTGTNFAGMNGFIDAFYSAGTVQFTATAGSGMIFVGWAQDLTGTTNPLSIDLQNQIIGTANFNSTGTTAPLAITSFSPATPTVTNAAAVITVTGTGFTTNSAITCCAYLVAPDGSTQFRQPTLISDTQLSIQLNAGDLSSAGYYQIIVLNVGSPPGNVCNPQAFGTLPVANTAGPPVLAISKSHVGNFAQGELGTQGAQYTVLVTNQGTGTVTAPVTVTETVPTGETLVSMSGTGWTCTTLPTCTTSNTLNAGLSYPAITVTVNVAAGASSPQVNSVTVSGGGSQSETVTDSTTIVAAPASIKATSGTGQSAAPNTAFTNPLVATVADSGSNPLQGLTVTFTAPASGASGKFSNGTNTISVVTDASGHASATFTANSTAGGYTVNASVESLTTSPGFNLTNTAGTCSINWKGTAGDNQWTTAANWDLARLPATADNTCIGAFPTITIGSIALAANQTIASLTSGTNLNVTAGPLAISGAATITGTLGVAGGTLTLNGASSVSGTTTLSSGTLGGSGTIALNGALTWTGGLMSGVGGITNANGGINFTGGSPLLQDRTLHNNAAVVFTGAATNFLMANSTVMATNFWNLGNDSIISADGGTPVFNNAGTFEKTGGTGNSTVNVPFNNTGSVTVSSGTITLFGGGNCGSTCNGSWTPGASGTLNFQSGTFAVFGSFGGAGIVNFNGATLDFGSSTDTLTATTINLSAGTVTGTGTLNFSTALNWTGGVMSGVGGMTNANGGINFTGGSPVLQDRTLNNKATAAFTGTATNFLMANSTVNNVVTTGVWNLGNDSLISSDGGTPVFNNAGIFEKTGGTGNSTNNVPFNNTGSVTGSTGSITFFGGGNCGSTCAGSWSPAAGGTLNFQGGTFAVSGTFNGAGIVNFDGATLNFGPSTDTLSTTTIDLSAGTVTGTGTLNFSTALNWTGGVMSGVGGMTNANGGINFTGGSPVLQDRTLNNKATAAFTGTATNFLMANSTVNNVVTTGVWNLGNDSLISSDGGTPVFNNAGIFEKTGGTGNSTNNVPFNNTGSVTGSTGSITFFGGGNCGSTCAGSWSPAAGGTLNFQGGTFAVSGTFNGAGIVNFDGATLNFGPSTDTLSTTTIDLSAGTVTGTGTLNFSTALNWTGGVMSGVGGMTNANGGINFTGGSPVLQDRTLNNKATAAFTGTATNFLMANSTVNNVVTTGVWNLGNDSLVSSDGGSPVFNNAGTFEKAGGTGNSTNNVPFNNTGSVTGSTGSITFFGGGNCGSTCAGSWSPAAGGTLNFQGGTFAVSGTFNGAGIVNFNGATLDFGSFTDTLTTTTINFNGGTVTGTGTLNFSTALNWTGGVMSGVGGMTNANGGINFTGGSPVLQDRTLNNKAMAAFTGTATNFLMANSTVNNVVTTGVWNLGNDSLVSSDGGSPTFNNAGTFEKTGGTGNSTINLPFTNSGAVSATSGTISYFGTFTQTAGSTFVGSATIAGPPNLSIQGGSITGLGTYTGNIANTGGTLAPGSGMTPAALTLSKGTGTGAYTQNASSVYSVKIGGTTAGTQYDQTNIAGAATLAGTLNATLINSFTPASGNSFTILTAASVTGTFGTTNLPTLPGGLVWHVTYNAASVVLSVGPATLTSIAITAPNSSIAKGSTDQFTATGTFSDGSTSNITASATWMSTNLAAVTINATGLATGAGVGSSNITAMQGGITSNSFPLTVTAATLTSIAITAPNSSIAKGSTDQFTATGTFSDGSTSNITASVTWMSTNLAAVTINATGLATGAGVGSSNITAVQGGITSNSFPLTVTAATLTSIAITAPNSSIAKGSTDQFTATGTFSDGSTSNITASVTWKSTNLAAVTINATGLATGAGVGSSNITAVQGGITSNSFPLTVTAATLTSIAITAPNSSIAKGSTDQFTATGTFSDGSTSNITASVTWKSTNLAAVTINATGLATGAGVGSSNITAVQGGITSNSFPLTVTAATLTSIAITAPNSSIAKGSTDQFTATGTFSDGSTSNITASATWMSTNLAAVTINATGLATGAGVGSSNITAVQGGITSNSFPLTVTAATLTSIAITAPNSSIAKGSTDQFTATGTFSDGSTSNITASVTWKSTNLAAVTINATGLATGAGVGSSNITAVQGGITSNSFPLTVTAATLTSIAITAPNSSIAKGSTDQFTATGTFSDGSTSNITASVTWKSTNLAAVTINATGLATGAGVGSSNITAVQGGITSNSFPLTVTAATLTSIAITAPNSSIAKGSTDQFTATGTFSDGSTSNITASATWTSTNLAAVTINATGLATGAGVGSSNITAMQGGITSNSFPLTVTAATLTSIAITAPNSSIAKGSTDQFTATGTFSDGSTSNITASVTWKSTNLAAVTINATGLATGAGVGSSNITAVQGGITSNSFPLTVTAATLTSIAITAPNSSIAKGSTDQFTATGTFSDGSTSNITASVTWKSTILAAVTINATGLATGAGVGSSNITAVQGGITSNSFPLTVTAATLTSIAITAPNSSIAKGSTDQFTATGTFSDGSTSNITASATWMSTNLAAVTINATGLATGAGVGSSNITAMQGGITSNSFPLTVTAATLTSIAITAPNSSIAKGSTDQFTATGTFSDGSTSNITASVTWKSTNLAAVTINATGLATGAGVGSSNITAVQGGITSNSFPLTVTAATLTSIAITAPNSSIAKGSTDQFTATGTFSDGSTSNITASATWMSTNLAAVTINATGLATGAGVGSSNITAVQGGITSNSFPLTVTAATLTSIAITAPNSSIAKGSTDQFTATGTFSDGSTSNITASVTWKSTNLAAVTINATGLATGAGVGSSNITAVQGGITSNSFPLTVTAATLTSIAITAPNSSIAKGSTDQFTATGTFSDGSTSNITASASWMSTNLAAVTINATGLATGAGVGSSNITAVQGGITSNSFPLTVTKATPLITWTNPANLSFGSALGSIQLDATANIPGTFVYNPPAGTVLLPGANQTLSVTFTPVDTTNYTTGGATALITINPVPTSGPPQMVVTSVLSRDPNTGNIVVLVTLANAGGSTAPNVQLTIAKIGANLPITVLPVSAGDVASGTLAQVTLQFPGSIGTTGTNTTLTVDGSYTGGTYAGTTRIQLP